MERQAEKTRRRFLRASQAGGGASTLPGAAVGRGRRRLRTRPPARALARPSSRPPSPDAEPPSGARRPGHRRAPALRRRRAAAHVTGSGGGGAGSPGAAAGAGGGAPRPRAARDGCAAPVRSEGRPEGAAGARPALGERPRRCSGAGAGGCQHDWARCACWGPACRLGEPGVLTRAGSPCTL